MKALQVKKVKMCPCGQKSIPGLVRGIALCQKHYNALMFGSGADHDEARAIYRKQLETNGV